MPNFQDWSERLFTTPQPDGGRVAVARALADAYQQGQTDALQRARAVCEDVETRWEAQDGYQEGASAAGECAEAVRRLLPLASHGGN